jgi:hypothetical protein
LSLLSFHVNASTSSSLDATSMKIYLFTVNNSFLFFTTTYLLLLLGIHSSRVEEQSSEQSINSRLLQAISNNCKLL